MGTITDVPNPEAIERLFANARKALENVEQNKQMIIKKLAEDLEYIGVPLDMICEEITDKLEGYATARYIRDCLDEKYKNRKLDRKKVTDNGGTTSAIIENNPIEISLTTNGKPANYDEEMKQLYNNARNGHIKSEEEMDKDSKIEELGLENGRLKEQLKEQKEQVQELVKSVNAVTESKQQSNRPSPATETLEYKAVISQNAILQERILELEQLVKKDMQTNPALGFQTASNINAEPTTTVSNQTTINEIEFPANLFGRFFIATRNVKKSLFLQLDKNGVVIGWEENASTKTTENQTREEAQPA